jgi:GT2 family glycosyltransferase
MEFDIVIPSTNVDGIEPLLLRCLQTIREYSRNYCLYFIQNGGELYESVAAELWKHESVQYIKNHENVGFVKAVNQGLRETTAPHVVIMNNDAEATSGWLEGLREPMIGSVGLSGPVSNDKMIFGPVVPTGPPRILPVGHMLCFFCVMIRRDVLDTVGLLDEDFGVGFGDDDNYSARAQAKGFELALVPDVFIPHRGRTTFRKLYGQAEIQGMQDEALLKHFDKLSGISSKIKYFQAGMYRTHLRGMTQRRGVSRVSSATGESYDDNISHEIVTMPVDPEVVTKPTVIPCRVKASFDVRKSRCEKARNARDKRSRHNNRYSK